MFYRITPSTHKICAFILLLICSTAVAAQVKTDTVTMSVFFIQLKTNQDTLKTPVDDNRKLITISDLNQTVPDLLKNITGDQPDQFNGMFITSIDDLIINGGAFIDRTQDGISISDFNKNISYLEALKFSSFTTLPKPIPPFNEYAIVKAKVKWVKYTRKNLKPTENRYKQSYLKVVKGADQIHYHYWIPFQIIHQSIINN